MAGKGKKNVTLRDETAGTLEDLLKKWLYNDCHTPKAKAEVSIDLLISEFVAGMIDQAVEAGNPACTEKAVLLAKEFPIPGYSRDPKGANRYKSHNDRILNSPAVDYLIMKGHTLYLAELKTDPDSFDDEQLFRMLMAAAAGSRELFAHYQKVIKKTDEGVKYAAQMEYLQKRCGEDLSKLEIREICVVYLLSFNPEERKYNEPDKTWKYTYRYPDGPKDSVTATFQRISDIRHDGFSGTAKVCGTVSGKKEDQEVILINLLHYASEDPLWKSVKRILTEAINGDGTNP